MHAGIAAGERPVAPRRREHERARARARGALVAEHTRRANATRRVDRARRLGASSYRIPTGDSCSNVARHSHSPHGAVVPPPPTHKQQARRDHAAKAHRSIDGEIQPSQSPARVSSQAGRRAQIRILFLRRHKGGEQKKRRSRARRGFCLLPPTGRGRAHPRDSSADRQTDRQTRACCGAARARQSSERTRQQQTLALRPRPPAPIPHPRTARGARDSNGRVPRETRPALTLANRPTHQPSDRPINQPTNPTGHVRCTRHQHSNAGARGWRWECRGQRRNGWIDRTTARAAPGQPQPGPGWLSGPGRRARAPRGGHTRRRGPCRNAGPFPPRSRRAGCAGDSDGSGGRNAFMSGGIRGRRASGCVIASEPIGPRASNPHAARARPGESL